MSETVNQGNSNIESGADESRVFTQAEVDAIIGDRLKRDRAKYADYEELKAKAGRLDAIEEAAKSELQKATEKAAALQNELDGLRRQEELRELRASVAAELGVPAALLTAEDEESMRKQAEGIIQFAKPGKYPNVKDGGEPRRATTKTSTRQQFADWFNSQS